MHSENYSFCARGTNPAHATIPLFLYFPKKPTAFVLASTPVISHRPAGYRPTTSLGPGVSPWCYIGVIACHKDTDIGVKKNKERQMSFLVSMRLEQGLPKSSRT